MKRAAILFFVVFGVSGLTFAGQDAKQCYKKCMEKVDDQAECEYICDYKE